MDWQNNGMRKSVTFIWLDCDNGEDLAKGCNQARVLPVFWSVNAGRRRVGIE